MSEHVNWVGGGNGKGGMLTVIGAGRQIHGGPLSILSTFYMFEMLHNKRFLNGLFVSKEASVKSEDRKAR